MTCCNVIIPNNKISLCILPMAECSGGGTPKILIFWLFLDNLSISEQTIDRALTIHTEIMIQWRKIISCDFHHIPKLSIGFNVALYQPNAMHSYPVKDGLIMLQHTFPIIDRRVYSGLQSQQAYLKLCYWGQNRHVHVRAHPIQGSVHTIHHHIVVIHV